KDIITEYLKDDFNESCLRYCSLTIWNKLKFETTQLNIIREGSGFVASESLKNRSANVFKDTFGL
ncbi:hypothetical protein, partial [Brenneria tiliae]|uniref:hypothetical protein n=1 Tax=Brenneria tiliae TaxID=2914984 RepID=UPI0020149F19